MTKRTSPKDAIKVHKADELEDVVVDKRQGWRANAAKARRRQRRYQRLVIDEIKSLAEDPDSDFWQDEND